MRQSGWRELKMYRCVFLSTELLIRFFCANDSSFIEKLFLNLYSIQSHVLSASFSLKSQKKKKITMGKTVTNLHRNEHFLFVWSSTKHYFSLLFQFFFSSITILTMQLNDTQHLSEWIHEITCPKSYPGPLTASWEKWWLYHHLTCKRQIRIHDHNISLRNLSVLWRIINLY